MGRSSVLFGVEDFALCLPCVQRLGWGEGYGMSCYRQIQPDSFLADDGSCCLSTALAIAMDGT